MVRLRIDIEAAAGDPKALNILLKTERNQAAEVEDKVASRLLPALRDLLKTRFADGDDAQEPLGDGVRSAQASPKDQGQQEMTPTE